MKVKEESEKVGLKLNLQKTRIMASGPITSWQIDGETVETVADFIFLGSKITAGGDWSPEIKMLTPWMESYDHPWQHSKKQRHYFTNKGPSSQGYGFSSRLVWMWELDYKESWYYRAQGWCTRMTQRYGMGKEVEGGFRMGNTCKSMADLCQCMEKTTTIL